MRWTSRGIRARLRIASITGGPMVRLGTKWPSITSTWSRSAPPASTRAMASPSAAKSAERMLGAMRATPTPYSTRRAPCKCRGLHGAFGPDGRLLPQKDQRAHHGEDHQGQEAGLDHGGPERLATALGRPAPLGGEHHAAP